MKKRSKAVLLGAAALTVLIWIAAVLMLRAVSGDALFYMNSTLGRICAVGCRWVSLAGAALLLFWICFAIRAGKKNRKKKLEKKAAEAAAGAVEKKS